MKKITKESEIASVAERWKAEYPKDQKIIQGSSEDVYKKLCQPNLTEDQVTEIIGNRSWTLIECDECNKNVDDAVVFYDDYDSIITVCKSCLNQALLL